MKASEPQIVRVLRAIREGCRTAREIAAFAQFENTDGRDGAKTAAAYLYALEIGGRIRKTGKVRFGTGGRPANTYELLPRGESELRWREKRTKHA